MSSNDFLNLLGNCFAVISSAEVLPLALLTAGLVGGFTHCVPMCGAFIFSQSKDFKKISDSFMIPYHLGRITTYMLMGILITAFLNMAFLFMPIRNMIIAPMLFVAGTYFIFNTFPKLKIFLPFTNGIRIKTVEKVIGKTMPKIQNKETILGRYLLGALLGFIPCGLTMAAYMAVAAAPNVFIAAFSMMSFGLGTAIALVISTYTYASLSRKCPNKMHKVTDFLTVISGLWLFVMASILII